jgi:CAAX prenyl protease-like protein
MLIARRARFFSRDSRRAGKEADTWNPTAAYLAPLLSGISVQLVAGLFSLRPEFVSSFQGLAIAAALWAYRRSYGPWHVSFSWAVLLIGAAAFAVHLASERSWVQAATSGSAAGLVIGLPSTAAPLVLANLARSIVLVPLAEELAFRGYLLRRLVSADFIEVSPAQFGLTALAISSVAFGVLQSNWIAGAIAGLFYAYAQHRRGRIEDAFLAHAVTSLLVNSYALWLAPARHL